MRLVSAEVLKLVRRRGTMIWCAILTIGSVLVAYTVLVALHAANASRHGPAGGADNFRHVALLLAGLGNVAAILIGAASGSQDASSGVLRDSASWVGGGAPNTDSWSSSWIRQRGSGCCSRPSAP